MSGDPSIYTLLPKGFHKNQGFNIIVNMLVNVKRYFCLSLRPFEITLKGDLKIVFHLTIRTYSNPINQ